jgi:hypothetical protein
VASDGETFAPLAGAKIVDVDPGLGREEIIAGVAAHLTDTHSAETDGVRILDTFTGTETMAYPKGEPSPDPAERYIVLADGETYGSLEDATIVEVAPTLEGDDVETAIKARCRFDDPGAGAGVRVLHRFSGEETTAVPTGSLPHLALAIPAAAPPIGEKLGERRLVVLSFLGTDGALADEPIDVAALMRRADTGDLIADVAAAAVEPLDGLTLVRLATAAGSEPSFFNLSDDGAPEDPDLS